MKKDKRLSFFLDFSVHSLHNIVIRQPMGKVCSSLFGKIRLK